MTNIKGQPVSPNGGNNVLSLVCSWCGEQILVGQPTSKSYDGETMHFGCAGECDDDDGFLGDCGS